MIYDFTIILKDELADGPEAWFDQVEGPLFERFEGDATPGIRAGIPYIGFFIEAESFDAAFRVALEVLEEINQRPLRIEIDADTIGDLPSPLSSVEAA